jgi:hypothetical protein
MDKTESTFRIMLTAILAPLYDIGVLSERGMLLGFDGISAAAVLDRLSLLKYRNAHGLHVYIRPSGAQGSFGRLNGAEKPCLKMPSQPSANTSRSTSIVSAITPST